MPTITKEAWKAIETDIEHGLALEREKSLFSLKAIAKRFGVSKGSVYQRRKILKEVRRAALAA